MRATLEMERLDQMRLPSSVNGLHADHVPIADVHFRRAVAVQVAEFHVGDAAVRILDGIFRVTEHYIPLVVQNVTALLKAGKNGEIYFSIGRGQQTDVGDEFRLADIQFMQGDEFAVQTDLGQGFGAFDNYQSRLCIWRIEDQDVARGF